MIAKDNLKTILVVVPHEDDEINLAGSTIYRFVQEGKKVICVFVTNGDWLYSVDVRMKEALRSLNVLGVPSEDAIFLGYPDGGVHGERSLFMHGKQKVMDAAGRTCTYGSSLKKDFATEAYGHPQSYTWTGLVQDLENVILKYKPDMIIGTDFDNHPDHRMCSIALDTAMGNILNQDGNRYFPIYLKGFAYSIAFEGKDDFFSFTNIKPSLVNEKALTYPEFGTDNPAFEWDERICIPALEACCTFDLNKNVMYKALCSYISQRIFVRAGRIINGDQVYWKRRTDNLIHQGEITVSSGEKKYLSDFQTLYTEDISVPKPVFENYGWKPEDEDTEKWCRCTFTRPHHIESISLWGNIEEASRLTAGELVFSNGYRCTVEALREKGRETVIPVEPQDNVQWIEFRMTQFYGTPVIAEWGIYETKDIPLIFEEEKENLKITLQQKMRSIVMRNWARWQVHWMRMKMEPKHHALKKEAKEQRIKMQ